MLKKISVFIVAFFLYAHAFSQQNVIQINFIDQLAKIGNDDEYPLDGYYILQNDLNFDDPNSYFDITKMPNFTTLSWFGIGKIGNNNIAFTGTFDGNNHIIKNWTTKSPENYIGFFRNTLNATIINLGLVNVKIQNGYGVLGGIIAIATNTKINNCFVTGSINGINSGQFHYGGLVGLSYGAKINNCFTNVDMGAATNVGGLVGQINGTYPNYIKNSYTAGKIKVLNATNFSLLVGFRVIQANNKDSILNTYSVGSFVGVPSPNDNGGLFIGGTFDNAGNTIDTLFVKGIYSIENKLKPIKFDGIFGTYYAASTNKTYKFLDTVFTGSTNRNFTPITTASNTYLYNATNQQYPLLYRSDMPGTLLAGQRAVYPAVIEKSTGSINGYADFVKPVDNFTKTGTPATYNINNINGINDFNDWVYSYFSINTTNGTLSWVEEIPTGEYLVEIRGEKDTENSQSWVRVVINRNNDAITAVNAQCVQFTTKDSTSNGDYIAIDSLNLVNRNYTIETWAKMENNVGGYRRIFNFGVVGFAPIVLTFPDATHLAFRSNGAFKTINLPAGFNAYSWNHYALTQQDNWAKLYLNGILIDSIAGDKPTVGFNRNYIGRSYPSTSDSATTGRFSELRIWLKAHSASQINALYKQKVPNNADSLYVYLPLTNIIYGEYQILADALSNAAVNENVTIPNARFNRGTRASVKYKYDSSQQYVYGTLNTALANNEILQIAVKDSNIWDDVQNISNYLFSYKLPENFISGNIYVRSIINGERTNRFGNTYNQSKYYVDWVGTGMKINPNLPYKPIPIWVSSSIIVQRSKNKLADTIFNPLVGNFTDAYQKTTAKNSVFTNTNYGNTDIGDYTVFLYEFYNINNDTTFIVSANNNPVSFIKFAYNAGNSMVILKNNAPAGIYGPVYGYNVLNSLGQANVGWDGSNLFDQKHINIFYGDSLKAIIYNTKRYINTSYKTVYTTIPTVVGNDSGVKNIRYRILARRNGVVIPNSYTLNTANFSITGSNRPIGTDSVFITFKGMFDEVLSDTLLFTYQLTKPEFSYQPNVIKTYSLINKKATSSYPVVDSGGGALTYSIISLNVPAGVTINPTTGLISVSNWDNLSNGNNVFSIRASNASFSDTTTITFFKNAFDVLYFSNSSYRTNSTNGADYIQLPRIDIRNKAFGMDIWYKHNAQTGNNHRIIDIGTGGNNQGIILMFPDSTHIFVRTPGQSDNPISIPAGVNIRNWNHYLISVSNTGVASFFINGKLIFSRAGGGTTPQAIFNSNFLGKSNYGGSDASSVGQFTDFRIWDNAIDSTIYNIRGLNNITTNGGANLIYYLPLSLPVYNQHITVENNDILKNASIYSPFILDNEAYIIGNSNTFNFDKDRIYLSGASDLVGGNKSVQATIHNFASRADTITKTSFVQNTSYLNNNYWGITLPTQQGTNLNNQIVTLTESITGTSNTYYYKVNYLPDYITYLPGDTIKVQFGNAGYVYPKNDYIINQQTPFKYTFANVGTLNNLISIDSNNGKINWTNAIANGLYPILVNLTNNTGTLKIKGVVAVGDSLKSIQYVLDSISVNYGTDSTNLPFTLGANANPTYSISVIPNNSNITIHPQNGKIYWNKNVPAGIYTLTIKASNYLNTIYKTIKLNIKGLSPSGLLYSTKINNYMTAGFDTSYVKINVQSIDNGGFPLVFTANPSLPAGFRFVGDSGNIVARLDSMASGNYKIVVTATNASTTEPNYTQDTIYINVQKTSKDTILGFKNAYMTFTTNNLTGNGDYINLPTIKLPNNFTIEAWVKLNDINRNYQRIFEAGVGNVSILTIATYASGRFLIILPTDTFGSTKIEIPDVTNRITSNTWFHLALVRNGINAKLYVNGLKVIDSNFTNKTYYKDSFSNAGFFRSNYSLDQSTIGQLDEIRIWNKALLPNEIERYRLFGVLPNVDNLYYYLPLNKSLFVDSVVANNSEIQNQAIGKHALQLNATAYGYGIKISRDSTRQILYGTVDTTTFSSSNKRVVVRTQFTGLPTTSDSIKNAVSIGNFWTTDYGVISKDFKTGSFIVTKNAGLDTIRPNKYFVKYPPYNLLYNLSNTIVVTNKSNVYFSSQPTLQQNFDLNSLVFSIPSEFRGISVNPITGVIRIHTDSAFKLYGKFVQLPVTASNVSGQTTAVVSIYIISANIIGYNNTSVNLPNVSGVDYIRLPSLDLINTNFAIEVWFKLTGSPINNKRIFDLAPGTTGAAKSGLILYFASNQLKFGAGFGQDNLINLGNADTALKNGLNEWNKYSIFYNASTKTYYVYINGEYKQMATVATNDLFTKPLISNFLANNNYSDPITDGYYREFKVYKNLSYTNFLENVKYSITPNRADASLFYYLPLSNNNNNISYIGRKNIVNGTKLNNYALEYNVNASKDSALIYTSFGQANYYGDSVNQFIEGDFGDIAANLRFSYTQGVAKNTQYPNVGALNYVWKLNGKNFYGKFKVFNVNDNTLADSINILFAPINLLYGVNNRTLPVKAGQSVAPTFKGTDIDLFSLGNTTAGISINAQTGVINWTNQVPAGSYNLRVYAKNNAGVDSVSYIFSLHDTLQGLSYNPDTFQATASNTDSLPFLPTFVKGTGAIFRILNPTTGFSININNGRINWLNTVPAGVYVIRVEANNVYNIKLTDTITITLSNQAPSKLQYIKDTMLFNQSVYSSTPRPTILTGGLTVRYSIQSISPNNNNISIDSITGVIKWTNGVVGNYTIQVRASNALGYILKTVIITINSLTNTLVDYNNNGLNLGIYYNSISPINRIELPKLDFRNSDYTIESWVKVLDINATTNWRRIFELGTGPNSLGLVLGFQTTNKLGMHSNTGNDILFNYPEAYNPLNWNHYAMTVSDSLRLYINGVLIITAEGNRPNVVYDKNFLNISIWASSPASANVYKECRIWKFERSAEDIAKSYQINVSNNTLGLYYYLPLSLNHYVPGEIVPIPNLQRAPEFDELYFTGYKSNLPNVATNSVEKDSAKIVTLIHKYIGQVTSYYDIDSTQQKIFGNYTGELNIGEQLQYSIDTGRTWKRIGYSKNNVFIQTIDTGFKRGLIKIRSIINNVVTNRVFTDFNVTVFPKAPTVGIATANNNGTVNLTFTPNSFATGVTKYNVYTASGQWVTTTTQSPVVISGLNNGQSYQFKVTAVNEVGESVASGLSNTVSSINIFLQITTYTNNAQGINVTPTSNELLPYTNFTVTYQLNAGYVLDSIIIDNVKIKNTDSLLGAITFTNINKSYRVNIFVSKKRFTISISKNEGGVLTPNLSTITVFYGDTTTIQIVPNNRYKIDSVFINQVYQNSTASSYTFNNIQQNITVRVVFKAKVYNTVFIELVGNGNVDTVGLVEVETGTNYTLRYSPKIGNRLDSVIVNNVWVKDSINSYTFTNIQSNGKIRLVFKLKTVTITAIAKNGTITPSGTNTYNYGTQIKYNFAPINNSYVLDSLLIDGVLQINPDTASYTFTNLDTNHIIQAVFNLKATIKYSILITKSEGVTVTPSSTQQVGYGGSLRVTWVGNTGYIFDSLFVNGKYNRDSINGYTFTNVRGVQSIYIKYKIKTFTITASAGLNGSISPLGISVVNYGTNKSYILLPNIGYETDSLFINGAPVTKPSDNIYTFNNVIENQTIRVTFKVNLNPCGGTKPTPNIVRVGDALKSDITTFAKQRWYLAGTIKDSTLNNTYTPTEAGVYTLIGVDVLGCESNISKKYYYAKTCITPAGRLGNGAFIQSSVIGNSTLVLVKWCTELLQENITIKILNLEGEIIYEQKVPASLGGYIINKTQINAKKYVIEVLDSKGEVLQISDVVN